MDREVLKLGGNTMKENTKMTETTATTAAKAVETEVENIFDRFASRLTGATTPVSLDINIAVGIKGSIGDVQLAVTSENYGTITNGAYRGETKEEEAAARAEEVVKREAARKEGARLLDLYTPEQLAEIINMIK